MHSLSIYLCFNRRLPCLLQSSSSLSLAFFSLVSIVARFNCFSSVVVSRLPLASGRYGRMMERVWRYDLGVTSFMERIRRAVYGGKDPFTVADVIRNVGQLEWTGGPADPAPFQGLVEEPAQLDPNELPWELREEEMSEG